MQPLTAFLLVISVVQWINADSSCSEENVKECLQKFQHNFEDYYQFQKKTKTDLDEFCTKLQEDSACLNDASKNCKETQPVISALTTTLHNHVNQPCTLDNIATYLKVLPCVKDHSKDFDECSGKYYQKKFDDELLQSACMDMHAMVCVAGKSRKHCGKEGESLAKVLELDVKDKYKEVCTSGCSGLFDHYWILTSAIAVSLLLSHKMKL